ncbi:MAG: hypothetical protein KIC37_04745 [Coriobacteriaceae bacterium]|nr:hypothetical protein [Olegusella massiliensis]MBS5865645.1 hypothetical protein [Coriobacteriaceae bacterium]
MSFTKVNINPKMFGDLPFEVLRDGELSVSAIRFKSGVDGLKISNSRSSMVVLPYMGMQIWQLCFDGEDVSQKSMFEEPLATTKFGDNYGGFLYHCGLNNINGPEAGEADYPMHDVLPFAVFDDVYIGIGTDEAGKYLSVGGSYVFRNSQELHWAYNPELKLYESSTMVEMSARIENRRRSPLEYLWLCHMNWLGCDGSRFVYSCPTDSEHIQVSAPDEGDGSPRAQKIFEYGKKLVADPTLADVLDSENQVFDPEMCINYKYEADSNGWAHALMERPDGDGFYVSWDMTYAPYALRWFCRTGDEDGVGIALPSTGTNRSSAYQRSHGHFNTLESGKSDLICWRFGKVEGTELQKVEEKIAKILNN